MFCFCFFIIFAIGVHVKSLRSAIWLLAEVIPAQIKAWKYTNFYVVKICFTLAILANAIFDGIKDLYAYDLPAIYSRGNIKKKIVGISNVTRTSSIFVICPCSK